MEGTTKGPPVPKPVQLFVVRLSTTVKSLRLYPTGSDIPRKNATEVLQALNEAMAQEAFIELDVTRDGLNYDSHSVFPRSESFTAFAREFYKRNLAAVRFHRGTNVDEILQFLSLIIEAPELIATRGGMEVAISELGIVNITVSQTATRILETTIPGTIIDGEMQIPDAEFDEPEMVGDKSIEEILEEAGHEQARDHRVLMRAMRDKRAVAQYLNDARERGGTEATIRDLAKRIGTLTRSTRNDSRDERSAALSVIAEAIVDLTPDERGELYQEHLIEQARRDRALAELVEKLGVEEVVDRIIGSTGETEEAMTGVSRAVRNLTLMNVQAPGETVLNLVVSKMQASGRSESFIQGMTTAAFPKRITNAEQFRTDRSQPVGEVLRLIDLTPDGSDIFVFDEAVEPLRQEALRGTTDGDVIESLLAIALTESRPDEFAAVMTMLEDGVGYLIEAQEADVAADVAEAMSIAARNPKVPEAHRARMLKVVQNIARPQSLISVTSVLRRYKSDSPEYIACRRLLRVLGDNAIDPLLEVLAEENDMAARKGLIEMISVSAKDYIPQLVARLSDKRWYFVRNIVSILASTRAPEVLVHFQRTMRHSDARVRRETIRGLASIRTAIADQMLIIALDDEDAQNVEIAAKYLGTYHAHSAVPALEALARGHNKGNHDEPARIAAVEALARLGSPSSMAIFRQLARGRGLLGLFSRGSDKALRKAATAALAMASNPTAVKGATT